MNAEQDSPSKVIEDADVAALIRNARSVIKHHVTSSWLIHLPELCRSIEAVTAQPSTIATDALVLGHSPAPNFLSVDLDYPQSAIVRPSPVTIARKQITPITVGIQNSLGSWEQPLICFYFSHQQILLCHQQATHSTLRTSSAQRGP